ncbi:MAG TPA: PadR family transcriptional regulator [Steroidobacteraceae bacterium]|nr:PadR family transcriptional regulator [Steroidobacteraceae bacterium]
MNPRRLFNRFAPEFGRNEDAPQRDGFYDSRYDSRRDRRLERLDRLYDFATHAMRHGGRHGHHGHGRGHGPGPDEGEWTGGGRGSGWGGGRGGGSGGGRGGGWGGGRGGGGRIFGPGDLRLLLLSLIAEKPRHGYELIKAIEQKFGGSYSPSPGSIYPTLTLLEELDQVRATAADGARKLFEITDQGRAYLEENRATLDGVIARMGLAARAMSGRAWPESVHQAMHTLKAALLLRPGEWTEAETERVSRIINQAVAAISNTSAADGSRKESSRD